MRSRSCKMSTPKQMQMPCTTHRYRRSDVVYRCLSSIGIACRKVPQAGVTRRQLSANWLQLARCELLITSHVCTRQQSFSERTPTQECILDRHIHHRLIEAAQPGTVATVTESVLLLHKFSICNMGCKLAAFASDCMIRQIEQTQPKVLLTCQLQQQY